MAKLTLLLFPFYVFLTACAIEAFMEMIQAQKPSHRAILTKFLLAPLVIFYLSVECWHLFSRIDFLDSPKKDPKAFIYADFVQNMLKQATKTALTAIRLGRERPNARIYVHSQWGRDIVYWKLLPYPLIRKVESPAQFKEVSKIALFKSGDALVLAPASNPQKFRAEASLKNIELQIVNSDSKKK